jgi:hypothetical protein
MFSSPTASPLPLFPPRLDKGHGGFDPAFPVRAAALRTPEAGPLSGRRVLTCAGAEPSFSPAPQAPRPSSQDNRRSAARVLMDEGWGECKWAAQEGDKFRLLGWRRFISPLPAGERSSAAPTGGAFGSGGSSDYEPAPPPCDLQAPAARKIAAQSPLPAGARGISFACFVS